MKKFFYILLLSAITACAMTSCTEEEVAPTTLEDNGQGGTGSDPKPCPTC